MLYVGLLVELSVVPALRYNPVPTIWKKLASAPVSVRLLFPRRSSVTRISAPFTCAAVLVFSGSDVTALFSAIAVGGWFAAVEGEKTQSWGWLASPPPFSLTT